MSCAASAVLVVILAAASAAAERSSPLDLVLKAEADRVDTIARVAPSVVCLFDSLQRGGGSGVLIDPEGYGLTNYHVVAGLLETRKGCGGLGDGVLYELEVLGIDVTGDVAMFRLIPPKPEFRFPYATLGDSDAVGVGDTAIAMGNAFSLSEDYTPTVTLGIVTGVHRYQRGVGGNLAYTDCIQVDAPINPGNSGGPLFNAAGEIIGINGRISVNTRGRFNVGFAYAISSNQIKRFIPHLRAGLLAPHGTWQARVEDVEPAPAAPSLHGHSGEQKYQGRANWDRRVRFIEVRESGPAYAAGIRVGDGLVAFESVHLRSANQVASILGAYPAHWPVRLLIEREGRTLEAFVRLEAIQPNMRGPFHVDRAANLRQVKRVLQSFQRAVYNTRRRPPSSSPGEDGLPGCPPQWRWTAVRHHVPPAGGTVGLSERFEVSQTGDGPIRMQQRYIDGTPGPVIEFDDMSALQRFDDDDRDELPAETAMVLGALYVMQRRLLEPLDEMDLTDVSHAGGAALVEPSGNGEPHSAHSAALRNERPTSPTQLLEVIEWPVADRAVARFAFDSESFLIVRITVRDLLLGAEATIDVGDHQNIGGLIWPCAIEVRGSGYDYCETWSDWELLP